MEIKRLLSLFILGLFVLSCFSDGFSNIGSVRDNLEKNKNKFYYIGGDSDSGSQRASLIYNGKIYTYSGRKLIQYATYDYDNKKVVKLDKAIQASNQDLNKFVEQTQPIYSKLVKNTNWHESLKTLKITQTGGVNGPLSALINHMESEGRETLGGDVSLFFTKETNFDFIPESIQKNEETISISFENRKYTLKAGQSISLIDDDNWGEKEYVVYTFDGKNVQVKSNDGTYLSTMSIEEFKKTINNDLENGIRGSGRTLGLNEVAEIIEGDITEPESSLPIEVAEDGTVTPSYSYGFWKSSYPEGYEEESITFSIEQTDSSNDVEVALFYDESTQAYYYTADQSAKIGNSLELKKLNAKNLKEAIREIKSKTGNEDGKVVSIIHHSDGNEQKLNLNQNGELIALLTEYTETGEEINSESIEELKKLNAKYPQIPLITDLEKLNDEYQNGVCQGNPDGTNCANLKTKIDIAELEEKMELVCGENGDRQICLDSEEMKKKLETKLNPSVPKEEEIKELTQEEELEALKKKLAECNKMDGWEITACKELVNEKIKKLEEETKKKKESDEEEEDDDGKYEEPTLEAKRIPGLSKEEAKQLEKEKEIEKIYNSLMYEINDVLEEPGNCEKLSKEIAELKEDLKFYKEDEVLTKEYGGTTDIEERIKELESKKKTLDEPTDLKEFQELTSKGYHESTTGANYILGGYLDAVDNEKKDCKKDQNSEKCKNAQEELKKYTTMQQLLTAENEMKAFNTKFSESDDKNQYREKLIEAVISEECSDAWFEGLCTSLNFKSQAMIQEQQMLNTINQKTAGITNTESYNNAIYESVESLSNGKYSYDEKTQTFYRDEKEAKKNAEELEKKENEYNKILEEYNDIDIDKDETQRYALRHDIYNFIYSEDQTPEEKIKIINFKESYSEYVKELIKDCTGCNGDIFSEETNKYLTKRYKEETYKIKLLEEKENMLKSLKEEIETLQKEGKGLELRNVLIEAENDLDSCESDEECEKARAWRDAIKAAYGQTKVEVNTVYKILNAIKNPDKNALKTAKLFGFEEDYSNLPVMLKETLPSQICLDKIDGYLDKEVESNGGVTKYNDDANNLEVLGDLRAQRSSITPDNQTLVTYSFYVQRPENPFELSVKYVQNGDWKTFIIENSSTSKGFDSIYIPLNNTDGIEDNSFTINLNTGDLHLTYPIILMSTGALQNTIESNGNSQGNTQAVINSNINGQN